MTWNPEDSYEPRREPLGQPAAPVDRPVSPYPPTVPMAPRVPMPPQYGPPPMYAQPQVVFVPQKPSSGVSTAAMVLGIVGLVSSCCTFGAPSILAVIFGHLGLKETANDAKSGHGQAVAGLVMGYVGVAPAAILSFMVFFGGLIGSLSPNPLPTP